MRILDTQEKGAGGEIQLTDAMAALIGEQPFHGLTVDAVRYDCGDTAGFIPATIALALERADVGPAVRAFIARLTWAAPPPSLAPVRLGTPTRRGGAPHRGR